MIWRWFLDAICRLNGQEYPEETLYFGRDDFPLEADVARWISDMEAISGRIKFPKFYVDRSEEHVKSWIWSFLKTEKCILLRDFSNGNGKFFEVAVLRTQDRSKLIFRMMLGTMGVEGRTYYDVSVQKYERDNDFGYICVE